MREIKFKLYFHDKEMNRLQYSTHKFEVTNKRLHIMLASFEENTIQGFVQYTDRKDKNDKEIYEGDIVHQFGYSKGFNHQVVFYNSRFCLMLPGGIHTDYIHSPNVEVIGNIYEHPHLLKS